jgi:DNA-binding response OmpR family regulator
MSVLTLQGRRIALVGLPDSDCARLREVLETQGAFCRTVQRDAVIPAIRTLETFDAVLFGLGGAPVASPVQQAILESCSAPVLMLAGEEDLGKRFHALGRMSRGYAVWPCAASEVVMRLCTLLRMNADQPRVHVPTVVIADDDPVISAVLETTLARHGFACLVAEDGDEALVLAQQFRPAVVILDVNMPGNDGFSVLRQLKADERTAAARVLMLTGSADPEDVRRGCSLGTDDYVLKPFNAAEVAARVKTLLGMAR